MPTVQLFVACETVLVSEDQTLSLISLLDLIRVNNTDPVPGNAALPARWCVVSILRKAPIDTPDTPFEQKIAVIQPNGVVALQAAAEAFSFTKSSHRQTFYLPAIPIGVPGVIIVQLAIRKSGTSDWEIVSEYPFTIEHAQTFPADHAS